MSIKVLRMSSGEQIVAEVKDLRDDNDKPIGFQISYPYSIVMQPLPQKEGEPLKFNMNYVVWMPACKDNTFAIPFSSVVAFGDAAPEVMNAYLTNFGEVIKEEQGEQQE
jgi:hypothetical protein